jgi:hypothetical protein
MGGKARAAKFTRADEWIAKRSFCRNNIVMENDDRNDVGVYNPKIGTIDLLPDLVRTEDTSDRS